MSGREPENRAEVPRSRKRRRLQPSTFLIVFAVLLAAGLIGFAAAQLAARSAPAARREPTAAAQATPSSPVETPAPTPAEDTVGEWGYRVRYQGETYVRRDKLKTVLFMGVDNVAYESQTLGNSGRTDSLVLFVLNTAEKTARMITISRDTMVPVDVYESTGRKLFTGTMQITMQYGYGDSPRRSALLTERRVGELIHGVNIDGYISLTMDGIAPIVDGLGGIRLTMDKDYSYINPAYTEGATVTLDGAAVQRFIRYRDTSVSGSNNLRMERQAWVVQQLFRQMRSGGIGVGQLLELADAFMDTDLDAETLRNFARYELVGETLKLPGESQAGEEYDEYYVDDEAVQALLIDVFYDKA